MSVDHILSIFRLMIHFLEKREQQLAAHVSATSATITALIQKREAHVSEQFRASAAIKRLKEFTI